MSIMTSEERKIYALADFLSKKYYGVGFRGNNVLLCDEKDRFVVAITGEDLTDTAAMFVPLNDENGKAVILVNKTSFWTNFDEIEKNSDYKFWEIAMQVSMIFHEVTHYALWRKGLQYDDGEVDFENAAREFGFKTNASESFDTKKMYHLFEEFDRTYFDTYKFTF